MAKIVDITEKLNFDENPCLVIKGNKIEVNTDAPTMLKVLGITGKDDPTPQDILEMYKMVFPDSSQKKLDKLKLKFPDLVVVIQEAVQLITGDMERGEL